MSKGRRCRRAREAKSPQADSTTPTSLELKFNTLRHLLQSRKMRTVKDARTISAALGLAHELVLFSGILTLTEQAKQEEKAYRARERGKAFRPGGRRPYFTAESAFTLMVLNAMLNRSYLFTDMASLAHNDLSDEQLRSIGVTKPLPQDQTNVYNCLWRTSHSIFECFDPQPCRRKGKATLDELDTWRTQWRDPDLKTRRARREELMNRLIRATLCILGENVRKKLRGIYAVDATHFVQPGRGLIPRHQTKCPDGRAATVREAGWYKRLDDRGNLKYLRWALELEVVIFGSQTASEEAGYPLLIAGLGIHRPGRRSAHVARRVFDWMHRLFPQCTPTPEYIAADQLYLPNSKVEVFQRPLQKRGYDFRMSYPLDVRGIQGQYEGALLVDGSLYCPRMPQALIDATAALDHGDIDKKTHAVRITARKDYQMWIKEHADKDGGIRLSCGAEGNNPKLKCALKDRRPPSPRQIILPDPTLRPAGDFCRQKSVKVPQGFGLKYRQGAPYRSDEWHADYNHPRNTVEAVNARLKNARSQGLGDPTTRLVRRATAQAIAATVAAMCVNIETARSWLRKEELRALKRKKPRPPQRLAHKAKARASATRLPAQPAQPHAPPAA